MADEKIKGKFINLEHPGRHHSFIVNDRIYHLKHNKIYDLTPSVIEALEQGKNVEYEIPEGGVNVEKGQQMIKVVTDRFAFIPVHTADLTGADKAKSDLISKLGKKQVEASA